MQEHGSYDLELTDCTHTLRAYGSWNFETAKRWGDETKLLIESLNNKPWACLVDLTEWELGTPDIREYLHQYNAWLNTTNLKCLAVVYRFSVQKEILKRSHVEFTNVDVKYSDNLDEATKWLRSAGF